MRWKVLDPFLLLKNPRAANQPKRVFDDLDIRVRVKGGGKVSQVYAVRQAIARGVVAYYQKFVTELAKILPIGLYGPCSLYLCWELVCSFRANPAQIVALHVFKEICCELVGKLDMSLL